MKKMFVLLQSHSIRSQQVRFHFFFIKTKQYSCLNLRHVQKILLKIKYYSICIQKYFYCCRYLTQTLCGTVRLHSGNVLPEVFSHMALGYFG